MSTQFQSTMGFTATLPEGSASVAESSAGPGSEQFSLPGGTILSVVRDDEQVGNYAQTIEWTQKMAAWYQSQFAGQVVSEGSLPGDGKELYAVAVDFNDNDSVPRIASVVGMHFPGSAFYGLTLLSIVTDPEAGVDTKLIQQLVDGITLTATAS